MSDALAQRRARFRALHQSGCFVMPNPWDLGGALWLQGMGFPALATTSAGEAWALGRPDGGLKVEEVLAHLRSLAHGLDVPLNADFENGHADDPAGVAENVRRAVATGVSGLSIEDYRPGRTQDPLYPLAESVARVKAARAAIDATGADVVLTARCEGYLHGLADLAATITRLTAYAEAGADCLFAPGAGKPEEVAAIVAAVAPLPVNVVVSNAGTTVAELAALGVRRISLGAALARAAMTALDQAARPILEGGSFDGLSGIMPSSKLNALFSR
jgi:2-methylisocitrate lyase-like PEP mutase family enzyme